jgi:toxin ParE1/3/4
MTVEWSDIALQDLRDIHDYIAFDNPQAALKIIKKIVNSTESLLDFSVEIGINGRVIGTKELAITRTNYIVVYRIKLTSVEVVAVLHNKRLFPENF